MEFFRIYRVIPFMQKVWLLNIVSLILLFLSVFFISRNGFQFSIEFTGGTTIGIDCSEELSIGVLRKILYKNGYKDFHIQDFGSNHEIFIQVPWSNNDEIIENQDDRILEALSDLHKPIRLNSSEFIGPQVRHEMFKDGLLAILAIFFGMFIYLSVRFGWKFSIAGIVANLHDAVIILGFFSFFNWEFSLSVLAGLLTSLGYSVNESVIIMDRIRENLGKKNPYPDSKDLINNAITKTLSRTIITHISTLVVVLSMLFFGGPSLHYFALALAIGIFVGIYSSIFVAASLIMWLGISKLN